MHVLIVDDDALVRTIIDRVLTAAGHTTQACSSAEEALAVIGRGAHPIDLVVTDVQMPGSLDGLLLATLLGRCQPRVPVIVMTGSEGSAAAASAIPTVSAVLAKPFAPAALLDALPGG